MNTKQVATAQGEATKTIKILEEGRSKKLLELIPKGQSPKVYLDLIKAQVLGVDKAGNPREDEDLLLFLYVCKRTGLDPLVKQIHAVFRWDSRLGKEKMTIQAGIDGMRLTAQRTGDYAGQDDVVYTPEDEKTKYPVKASVTVWKTISNVARAFTASARWDEYKVEYKGKLSPMWESKPYLMLGKCAEALALRKAFPNELSGIYTTDEIPVAPILPDLPTPKSKEKTLGSDGAASVPKNPAKAKTKQNVLDIEPDMGKMRAKLKADSEKKIEEFKKEE